MKTKIIPFDLEIAKKIQAGEIEGRIVTTVGGAARIVCFDKETDTRHPLVVLIHDLCDPDIESVGCYTTKGKVVGDEIYNLCIELHKEAPKHKFKPFGKVLVRDCEREHPWWTPAIFQETDDSPAPYMASGLWWRECIPYEGNEHLVGTTGKPKEE